MEQIQKHSLKIGFDLKTAIIIARRIGDLAKKYDDPPHAISIFSETYPLYVNTLFSNSQLDTFLRIVGRDSFYCPTYELDNVVETTPDEEYPFEFFPSEFENEHRMGNLSFKEIERFLEWKGRYIAKTRIPRQLNVLNNLGEEYYPILTKIAYRLKKECPNFEEPRATFISTPIGGQPGYRMKTKRR